MNSNRFAIPAFCLAALFSAVPSPSAAQLALPGGLSLPLRKLKLPRPQQVLPQTSMVPGGGNAALGIRQADDTPPSPLVKKTQDAADAALRIVLYGIDNELPDRSDLNMAKFLMRDVRGCLDGIAEIRKVNPAQTFRLNGQDPMSIDEVEQRFCKPAFATLQPLVGAAIAADEARWAGLAPERVAVVKMHGLGAYTIYGHGKRVLSSSAALQSSNVWYVWDEETGYLTPHWWMATIRWTGNSYVKTVQKGAGTQPPASLFR
ncbi:MAG TPA: hypothetical protein VF662_05685 [Allosphingosinicella sp.]